jgi:ABC-2 type transport system ATP-binding protein
MTTWEQARQEIDVAMRTHRLTKLYGQATAVDGVSLEVGKGELFGLLGPNGAGKSTMIAMLCGLLSPTRGTAVVDGYDVRTHTRKVRRRVGIVFQESTVDSLLTVQEHLYLHAALYGVPPKRVAGAVAELLELVGLGQQRRRAAATLSGGMRRRLEIARALVPRPRILFLDEPALGLDPQVRHDLWSYLQGLRRQGITLFFTTHYLEEAENCDRIAIIDTGRIVALDTPAQLKAYLADTIELVTCDDVRARHDLAEQLGLSATTMPGGLRLCAPNGAALVPRLVAALSVGVSSISVRRPTLDDVFLRFAGRTIDGHRPSGQPAAGEGRP